MARDALCPFPSRREGRLLCWVLAPAAWGWECVSVTETIAQGLMLRPKLGPVLSSEQLCVCVAGEGWGRGRGSGLRTCHFGKDLEVRKEPPHPHLPTDL